ncbi:MAG: hypothetical protein R2852_09075 [Bacteroidia bacterium]
MKQSIHYLQNPFFWKRIVIAFIGILMIWFWYSGMLLHHIWDSPFNYKGADISFWLVCLFKIPDLILLNYYTAITFSFFGIILLILAFYFIENRSVMVCLGMYMFIYQVVFNLKLGYHTHHLYGMHFALLPFYFNIKHFKISAEFSRVLVCLTYLFAGLFKLKGMAWMHIDSFSNTLQNQHAAYFHFNDSNLRTQFAYFLIEHQFVSWILFCSAMLLQLSFVLGLLTSKFDKYLALFIILFHLMDWFLMNLGVFMSMTILVYLFLLPSSFKVSKIK